MIDLSLEACRRFWKDYPDPMIYRVLTFMEGVEQAVLDGDAALEQALSEFSDELSDLSQLDLSKFGHEDAFIWIAAHLKMTRMLRLLQVLDSAQPGSASRLLVYAEDQNRASNEPFSLFLRRNMVFERLRLIGRVFAKQRFLKVLHAIEGEEV